ncbi:metalloregulator ArsR/SmtB family transcription factor [Rhodopseudomonas telluris]|uniref:Metalloregulator ArsR/SmtB family transcription factor n=1 Tax=Rhodopseudomonas telluris TaxID=644215 RepID=A0ABV6EM97_9BRAD
MPVTKRVRKPSGGATPRVDTSELRENVQVASEFLKTLSNASRLLMLCQLAEGEKSVSELAELLDERQPTVSQQLARLRSERLVETRREGQQVFYSLASDEVRSLILALHAIFCKPAGKIAVLRPRAAAAKSAGVRR